MSNNHQGGYQPPTTTATTGEFHRQSSTTTAGNSLQTQSPITPTTINNNTINTTVEPNSTPESRLAAAIGRAILNIPPTSFQDALAAAITTTTTTPLIRTTSNSSVNQVLPTTTNATPPKIPTISPIRRAVSDTITTNYKQQPKKTIKKPIRRSLSDTPDQIHKKIRTPPPKNSSSSISTPESSNQKSSPFSERLRDFVLEINKKYLEIVSQEETIEDENQNPNSSQPKEEEKQEECVAVERVKNGDIKFDLSCSCGKHFEMLIKPNGYCFYRLT
ncbi:uncharacterized protein [Rutidosis leptorrhynchoides]|uniref:uncharacterized protein n=1 Tax=Rutidosis leptorrhynchoides TaxID=125765 RepID=UPI003A991AD0